MGRRRHCEDHGSVGALALFALVACGARDRVELVHPSTDDGALRIMAVDYQVELTPPDNFVLRPDELGGVTVDAQRGLLYAGSRDGTLTALVDDDGAVAWEHPLGGSIGALPLIVEGNTADDTGVLLVGTDNGVLHALDIDDRSTRWSYETPGRISNVPVVHEGVVFFVNSRDQIYALDLRTGQWRWQYEQELQTDFTVHGHAGLTLVPSSGEGVELGTLYACFDNGKVAALAAGSGEALWLSSVAPAAGGNFSDCDSTPLVDQEQGLVYVAGQSTGVHALSADSGEVRWRFEMRAAGTLVPTPDGGLAGVSPLDGVFVLEADGSRLRWRSRTDPGVLSTPVVVQGQVFVSHSELGLLAFDQQTGELSAQLRTGSGMGSQVTYDPGRQRVFAISNRGTLFALRVGDAIDDPWWSAGP